MKVEKNAKKLELSKSTISHLTGPEALSARGGTNVTEYTDDFQPTKPETLCGRTLCIQNTCYAYSCIIKVCTSDIC